METKEVEIGKPVTVAGLTVIPITRCSLSYWHGERGISFFGFKQPGSVIIVSPSARKAFRITGEEISLEQLIQEVPEAKEMLDTV